MVRTLYLERESREGNGGASRPGTSVSVKPFPEVKLDYLLAVDIPLPRTDHHEEVSTAGKWRREGGTLAETVSLSI